MPEQPANDELQTWFPTLTGDSQDFLEAVTNIWIALEAIKECIPPQQAMRVGIAIEGIAQAMKTLTERHNIHVPDSDRDPATPSQP